MIVGGERLKYLASPENLILKELLTSLDYSISLHILFYIFPYRKFQIILFEIIIHAFFNIIYNYFEYVNIYRLWNNLEEVRKKNLAEERKKEIEINRKKAKEFAKVSR